MNNLLGHIHDSIVIKLFNSIPLGSDPSGHC